MLTKTQLRAIVNRHVLAAGTADAASKSDDKLIDDAAARIAMYELQRIRAFQAAGLGVMLVSDPIKTFGVKNIAQRVKARQQAQQRVRDAIKMKVEPKCVAVLSLCCRCAVTVAVLSLCCRCDVLSVYHLQAQ